MRSCPIPEHADLEFARNTNTGTVHILPYVPTWSEDGVRGEPMSIAEGLMQLTINAGRHTMLCGTQLGMEPWGVGGEHVGREDFRDEALCILCVKALGDRSVRAFKAGAA